MGSLASEGSRGVYIDYEQHNSVGKISTLLTLTNSILAHHPNHLLATVAPCDVDLLGYAKAGHATAKIDIVKDPYLATRSYAALPNRWSKGEGTLQDHVTFAKYDYAWKESRFVIYVAECFSTGKRPETQFFVLHHAKIDQTVEGKSLVVDELIKEVSKWTLELHEQIWVYDGWWDKSHQLWEAVQESRWDDVILDPDTKQNLITDVEGFFDAQEAYKKFTIQWKRGIIIHGSPGNGKTVSIKALMYSLSARAEPIPSLYVKSFTHPSNNPQSAIKGIFAKARATAPCLLVLEDLDSLVTEKVRSYFLNEVDGLESNDGILILGSTNHLDKLDPAIVKRPSRFDRKYPFYPPALPERIQYCQYWIKKLQAVPEARYSESDCEPIANLTDRFTFAYIKEAFVATLFHLFAHQEEAKAEVDAEGPSAFVKAFAQQVEMLREQMAEKVPEEKEDDQKPSGKRLGHIGYAQAVRGISGSTGVVW